MRKSKYLNLHKEDMSGARQKEVRTSLEKMRLCFILISCKGRTNLGKGRIWRDFLPWDLQLANELCNEWYNLVMFKVEFAHKICPEVEEWRTESFWPIFLGKLAQLETDEPWISLEALQMPSHAHIALQQKTAMLAWTICKTARKTFTLIRDGDVHCFSW